MNLRINGERKILIRPKWHGMHAAQYLLKICEVESIISQQESFGLALQVRAHGLDHHRFHKGPHCDP